MAQTNPSVKKVEVCRVAPKPGAVAENQSLSLTFFDLIWFRLPMSSFELVYFYQTSSTDSILPKLKTSLSLALQHFLPLAGNLTWPEDSPKPVISYVQGDAVLLTVAESDADHFDHLIKNTHLAAEGFTPLVPYVDVTDDGRAAAMALQITIFPNRGFSVGFVMNHAALDGRAANTFIKAWAHISKHEDRESLPSSLVPFYDRRVIEDQINEGPTEEDRSVRISFPNIIAPEDAQDFARGTFDFTRASIQTLRGNVTAKTASDSSSLYLSTFTLVCGYTWVSMLKAEEIKGEKTAFIFGVDCRSRLDPPMPTTYFGGCITGRVAVAEIKSMLSEDGLVVAVNALSEALRSCETGLLNEEYRVSSHDFSLYDRIYGVSWSNKFKVYDTDYGWGRPKRVEVVSIRNKLCISLSESKNGGGVEVGVILKKPNMEAFDALFATLTR